MATFSAVSGLSVIGGGSPTPADKNCGWVVKGGSFPTTKKDGSPLEEDDYVKASGLKTDFPFTISGVTFEHSNQKAFYDKNNNRWNADFGSIVDTSEVVIKSADEKILGTEKTQKDINIAIKKEIDKKYVHSQTTESNKWIIQHNKNTTEFPLIITVYDESGKNIGGAVWETFDNNRGYLNFFKPFKGIAKIIF